MKNIDPRMIFGFALLVILAILAGIIAIGHIEEKTSFGLPFVLGGLTGLSGAFGTWAFSGKPPDKPPTS